MLAKFKILIIVLVAIVSLTSCSTTSKIGMIGTRNIDYSATYEKGDITEAKGGVAFIFPLIYIPIIVQLDDQYPMEIIDQALAKGNYEYLTDVTVIRYSLFTWFYNYFSYEVKGTGWRRVDSNKKK